MATATGHVFSGLTISGGNRNSFLNFNHTPFTSNLPLNFNGVFSRGYLSKDMFFHQTRSPVVCMSQTKASRRSSKKKVIRLVSKAGTGFFYAMKKSRTMAELELKKYDPKVRRHVVFRESK